MTLFQLVIFEAVSEAVLLVLCVAVFYWRRRILVPYFQAKLKSFLGIYQLELRLSQLEHPEEQEEVEIKVCEGGNPTYGYEYCENDECQHCCTHDERDHGICLTCGHEEDPGAAIDRAMDSMEDR